MWEGMSRVTIPPQAVNKSESNEYDDEADDDDQGYDTGDDNDGYLQLSTMKFDYLTWTRQEGKQAQEPNHCKELF